MKRVGFIHSKLDDAGLSCPAFRVYCHLLRRMSKKNLAWPGVRSMALVCRLNKDTIGSAILELEIRKMIRVTRRRGYQTYSLTDPSAWTVRNEGTPVRNKGTVSSVRKEGTHRPLKPDIGVRKEGTKGNPLKELQLRKSILGGAKAPQVGFPSLKQVLEHAEMIGHNADDAEKFFNEKTRTGWKIKGKLIREWRKVCDAFCEKLEDDRSNH